MRRLLSVIVLLAASFAPLALATLRRFLHERVRTWIAKEKLRG